MKIDEFPPCTGGCIARATILYDPWHVSSPVREGVSVMADKVTEVTEFSPCTGGCIVPEPTKAPEPTVSSLYGRVYRNGLLRFRKSFCFLPVREGVSLKLELVGKQFKFPPCMGGCIVRL